MLRDCNFWQWYSLCHSHIIKLTSTWLLTLSIHAHPVYSDIFCFLLYSMGTEGLLSFPHSHQPLCKFKLCSWRLWLIRIFTACFIFTQDPYESLGTLLSIFSSFFEPFLGSNGAVSACLDSNLWPGDRKPGCSDSFCYHLAKRNTKTLWCY